ncbi:MAG: hypothetical protein H0T43_05610 [Solirubrobacterales bacterium]|nr:hypothetical protein [Solirubrobacterales bacterium]
MRRLRDERGSTVVTAIVLLAMMMMMGLATAGLVDGQQEESGRERARESSLNLNEGVLYAQAFVLARNWPSGDGSVAFPATCGSGSATTTYCPNRDTLAAAGPAGGGSANFTAADYRAGATWTTKVRDNGGVMEDFYYSEQADVAQAGCPVTPCTKDHNGDRQLWVQVSTKVHGRPRSVVALLQLEEFKEAFPTNAVTAGHVTVSNNGNHGGRALVDITGSQIAVRCDPADPACIVSNRTSHIQPRTFAQLPATQTAALSPTQLQRLKARAIADGRYFESCPPANANLAGEVVWVEECSGSYGSSLQTVPCPSGYPGLSANGGCINTPASPGILIWHKGTAKFTGNDTFVGLIHMANDSDGTGGTTGTVLETGGGFQIFGAASVDGGGGLKVGSAGVPNIKFFPNVFNSLASYGTAGLVQNTWRELDASG